MKRGVTPSKESDKGSEGATGGDTSVSESNNERCTVESEVVKDGNKGSGKRGNSGKEWCEAAPPCQRYVSRQAKRNQSEVTHQHT